MKQLLILSIHLFLLTQVSGNELIRTTNDLNSDIIVSALSPETAPDLNLIAKINNNELHFTTTDNRPCLGFQFSFLYDTTVLQIEEIEVLGDPDPINYNEIIKGRYIVLFLSSPDTPIDLSQQNTVVKLKFTKAVPDINLNSFLLSSCTELEAIFVEGDSFVGTGISCNLAVANDDCNVTSDCDEDHVAPIIECGYSEIITRINEAGNFEISASDFRNRIHDNCAINKQIKVWLSLQNDPNAEIKTKITFDSEAEPQQTVYLFARDGNENTSTCAVQLILGEPDPFEHVDTLFILKETVDGIAMQPDQTADITGLGCDGELVSCDSGLNIVNCDRWVHADSQKTKTDLAQLLKPVKHECISISEEIIHWIDSVDHLLPPKRSLLINSTTSKTYTDIPIGSYQIAYQWIYSNRTCSKSLTRNLSIQGSCEDPLNIQLKTEIIHRSDYEILFPEDLTLTSEAFDAINMDSLSYSLQISDDEFELVGIHYEDIHLDKHGHTLIQRTWTAIDWCIFYPPIPENSVEVYLGSPGPDSMGMDCDYRYLKDGGDGVMQYRQNIIIAKPLVFESKINVQTSIPKNRVEKNVKIKPNVTIHPNPLLQESLISYENESNDHSVGLSIYSPDGRLIFSDVKETHSNSEWLIRRHLFPNTGVYLVKVQSNFHALTKKIIVQ